MGGVPVLMALAAMGIGYGWHPDGNGGVEYVIQIPPEKFDHVREAGEITSSIPPEVQGRVSRVVVRVSDEPPERQTPPPRTASSPASQSHRTETPPGASDPSPFSLAEADHAPVPIPEIPASGVAPVEASVGAPHASLGHASVLKPAPQSGAGSGFQFPQNRQATGSSSPVAAGRTGAMAPPNPGGPSTEPTDTQDESWYDLQGSGRQETGGQRTGQPSTERQGSGQSQGSGQAQTPSDPPSLQQNSAPERSESDPRSSPDPRQSSRERDSGIGSEGREEASAAPQPSSRSSDRSSDAGRSSAAGPSATGASAQAPSRNGLPDSSSDSQASSTGRGDTSASSGLPGNFGRMPDRLQSSPDATTDSDRRGDARRGSDDRGTPAAASNPRPVDPRLNQREASALPPGGWSYDAYGRPIDREGYVLDRDGRRVAATDRGARSASELGPPRGGYPSPQQPQAPVDRPSYPSRYANSGAAAPDPRPDRQPDWSDWSGEAGPRYASTAPSEHRTRGEQPTEEPPRSTERSSRERTNSEPASPSADTNHAETPSTASRDSGADVSADRSGDRSRASRSVAAQPLFNGLLLISIVANVYLAFWLRNLRHQFRELVAAKRAAASSGSS